MSKARSIHQLIMDASRKLVLDVSPKKPDVSFKGACRAVAQASEATQYPVSHWAVQKWPSVGISAPHFPLIMSLAEATADEINEANMPVLFGPHIDDRRRRSIAA